MNDLVAELPRPEDSIVLKRPGLLWDIEVNHGNLQRMSTALTRAGAEKRGHRMLRRWLRAEERNKRNTYVIYSSKEK